MSDLNKQFELFMEQQESEQAIQLAKSIQITLLALVDNDEQTDTFSLLNNVLNDTRKLSELVLAREKEAA